MRKEPLIETISRYCMMFILHFFGSIVNDFLIPTLKWCGQLLGEQIKNILTTFFTYLIKYVVFWIVLIGAIVFISVWAYNEFDFSATILMLKQFSE